MFEVPTLKDSIKRFTARLQQNFEAVKTNKKAFNPSPHVAAESMESKELSNKKTARNIEIVRITSDSGYRHVRNTLEAIEGEAYLRLRAPNPPSKPAYESLEFFMGKQVGKLEVVDDLRLMEQTAIMELEKQKLKEKEEYERSQRTKPASK